MPMYRVLVRSFINNAILEEGAVVEYDGEVSDNLALIEDEKPKRGRKAAADPEAVQEQGGE